MLFESKYRTSKPTDCRSPGGMLLILFESKPAPSKPTDCRTPRKMLLICSSSCVKRSNVNAGLDCRTPRKECC